MSCIAEAIEIDHDPVPAQLSAWIVGAAELEAVEFVMPKRDISNCGGRVAERVAPGQDTILGHISEAEHEASGKAQVVQGFRLSFSREGRAFSLSGSGPRQWSVRSSILADQCHAHKPTTMTRQSTQGKKC